MCCLLFSVAPALRLEPSSGPIVVRSGTTVALKCKTTSGNPEPAVTWRKRNDRLPASAEARTLDIRVGNSYFCQCLGFSSAVFLP